MIVKFSSRDDLQWLLRTVSKQLRFAKDTQYFSRDSELDSVNFEIVQCERILNTLMIAEIESR